MNYLISHYKGQYRILCEYDNKTNQFPRKLDGSYEDIDCYITCYNNIRIYSFGHSVLQAYIPSLQRGRNIIKTMKEKSKENLIFDIEETDSEVLFKFNARHMNELEQYLRPKTNGASISPFSSKNLPKNKSYKIPDEENVEYTQIVQKLGKKRIIELTHMTNNFIKSLSKNNEDIKADMAIKGLRGKDYIHSIDQWDKYISYLKKNLEV